MKKRLDAGSEMERERDFRHPYRPYDIQAQFMEALYGCIEDGGVGIFESPTGEFCTRDGF